MGLSLGKTKAVLTINDVHGQRHTVATVDIEVRWPPFKVTPLNVEVDYHALRGVTQGLSKDLLTSTLDELLRGLRDAPPTT